MTKPIARDSIYRGRRFDADIIEDGPRDTGGGRESYRWTTDPDGVSKSSVTCAQGLRYPPVEDR